jgi:hypothetical protein
MEFQVDTRKIRNPEVRMGLREHEITVFRKVNSFIHSLKGEIQGVEYQLKLPMPWNGSRYRLLKQKRELASATRTGDLHAFETERPLIRHRRIAFDLNIKGTDYRLTPEDRWGLSYVLYKGAQTCGYLSLRSFEEQQIGEWQGDLEVPEFWTPPLATFVAWLAQESRISMNN